MVGQWWSHVLFLLSHSAPCRCTSYCHSTEVPKSSAIFQNLGPLHSGIFHTTSEHTAGQAQPTVNVWKEQTTANRLWILFNSLHLKRRLHSAFCMIGILLTALQILTHSNPRVRLRGAQADSGEEFAQVPKLISSRVEIWTLKMWLLEFVS